MRRPAMAALVETILTMLAVALSVATALLLDPTPGSAVLGGMLALSLSRSQLERDGRGRLEAGLALPAIGVLAAGAGILILAVPIVGAVVYTLAVAATVWIRRFGPMWRRLGALLALPFTALLVAPVAVPQTGPLAPVGWLVPILIPLIAFAWVTLLQVGARAAGLLPAAVPAPVLAEPVRPSTGLRASDRMAIQIALALALAFTVGFLVFPDRWAWTVLTVVILLIGTAGRTDAAVKGVSRFIGAGIGSAVAALLIGVEADLPVGLRIGLAALALGLGVFLRRSAYIWWALFFTIALTLVQSLGGGADGSSGRFLLGERLIEILVGAVIAIGVAWFVLPVPTSKVVLRRMAEYRDAARPPDGAPQDRSAVAFARRRLKTAAEPFLLLDRLHLLPQGRRELVDRVKAILSRT